MDHTSAGQNGRDTSGLAITRHVSQGTVESYQSLADENRGTGGKSAADLLGFFSLGLGLAEVLAPQFISKVIGVSRPDDGTRNAVRLMGIREIGHGLSILSAERPAKEVSARIGGDMLDFALLARTFSQPRNNRTRTAFAAMNVAAVTALDVMAARQLARQPETEAKKHADDGTIESRYAVTISGSPSEIYSYWRDLEKLPAFMRHLESVTVLGDGRSRWKAKAPAGSVEWDAEIIEDVPGQVLSWRSLPGADVSNSGEVRFLPAADGQQTEVRLTLRYDPPMGRLAAKFALLFREEPTQQAKEDLRHFKQMMETGEILYSDSSKTKGPHPSFPTPEAPKQ